MFLLTKSSGLSNPRLLLLFSFPLPQASGRRRCGGSALIARLNGREASIFAILSPFATLPLSRLCLTHLVRRATIIDLSLSWSLGQLLALLVAHISMAEEVEQFAELSASPVRQRKGMGKGKSQPSNTPNVPLVWPTVSRKEYLEKEVLEQDQIFIIKVR
jgi:hypothetical protein